MTRPGSAGQYLVEGVWLCERKHEETKDEEEGAEVGHKFAVTSRLPSARVVLADTASHSQMPTVVQLTGNETGANEQGNVDTAYPSGA